MLTISLWIGLGILQYAIRGIKRGIKLRITKSTNSALVSMTLAFSFSNQLRFTKIVFKHMMLIRLDESIVTDIIRKLIGMVVILLGCLEFALCMPVVYKTGKERLLSFLSCGWVKTIQDRTTTRSGCKDE